jgi:hypothetical protein
MSSRKLCHIESVLNAVLGITMAQAILWLFAVPFSDAIGMNRVLFFTSWARAFVLRILFARIAK